jgi:serine/threonine-protein phosphatase PGAM5
MPGKDESRDSRVTEGLEKLKAKAVRHIILIRHGQYNMSGKTDKERTLTELGKTNSDYMFIHARCFMHYGNNR